tara:strand:+ start:16903 stop:17976 length:1074 start_codon:yes stop_codon:yes gene_type:complete
MRCLACKNYEDQPQEFSFQDATIHKLTDFDEMKILVCSNCGLGVVNQQIDSAILNDYYNSTYGGKTKKFALSDMENPLGTHSIDFRSLSQLTLINNFIELDESTAILEIGSGKGDFYTALKNLNIKSKYITYEPQKEAQEKLQNIGIETINKSFEPDESVEKEEQYDLIVMSHCLEHFHPDSVENTISAINRMLKPGGYFFCEVPNADLLKYPNAGERVVPHLTFFSTRSLEYLLSKHNFEINFLKTCGNLQAGKNANEDKKRSKARGMYQFSKDTDNGRILRNVYYDNYLREQSRKASRKNRLLKLFVIILGKRISKRIFNLIGKMRRASVEDALSTEYFRYKDKAEFIRLLARKG